VENGWDGGRVRQGAGVSLAQVLARSGGWAGWPELAPHTTRHRLRQALADGEIVRVARGVYALPSLAPDLLAAARAGGALCLESAAVAWELPTWGPPGPITVALRRGTKRPPVPGVTYRWCGLSDQELADGRTGMRRTVLDCAALLPFPRALAVADGALRDGWSRAELLQPAEALPGPGRARRLRVLRAADGRAENAFESALRAVLIEGGSTGFEPQVLIRAPGFAAQVDLAHRGRRIVIEAEGFAYHGATARAFNRDLRRYDELVRRGWRVLRFTWHQVLEQPDWIVDVVRTTAATAPSTTQLPARRRAPGTIRQPG
jgi:very-short-patch-repair endonuclease